MPTFKLVSFNAHGGLNPRRNGVCVPYDLVDVLRGFDADVIVMQEAWWPDDEPAAVDVAADDLGAKIFALRSGAARSTPGRTCRGTGLGQGTVGLVDHQQAARPASSARCRSDASSPTRRRTAAALHVELDVDGTTVDLVGVHLIVAPPLRPADPAPPARAAAPAAGAAAVVAGDCNFWGPGVRTFLPGWRRAVRGRTWPASRPHSQIDHILVRPEIGVVNSEVLGDVGSDHRPVRATLTHRRRTTHVGMASTTVRGVVSLAKGAPVEIRDVVVPDPGPGEARVQRAGVRCVPHRPALPGGRDQRRLPVPARSRGRGHGRVRRARRARPRARRLRDPELASGVRHVPGVSPGPPLVLLLHLQRHAEDDAHRRHAALAGARHRRVRRADARRRGPGHEGRRAGAPGGRRPPGLRRDGRARRGDVHRRRRPG